MTAYDFNLSVQAYSENKDQEFDMVYWHADMTLKPHTKKGKGLGPRHKNKKVDTIDTDRLNMEIERRKSAQVK
jgi:hypothetical protein